MISTGTFAGAGRYASEELVWRYFGVAQIWIYVLFVVYFRFTELTGMPGLKGTSWHTPYSADTLRNCFPEGGRRRTRTVSSAQPGQSRISIRR